MSMHEPTSEPASYACPACGRRFVVVAGEPVGAPPRCVCGRELERARLASGVYELRRARRASSSRRSRRAIPARAPSAPTEPDLGYGESHGYGPAHGGPTGPADAPAPAEGETMESEAEPTPRKDDESAAA